MIRTLIVTLSLGVAAVAFGDAGGQNMTGKKELAMMHCPSAVPGTRTQVADTKDGVVLTLSAPLDPVAQQEIRKRVQYQLEIVDQPERGAIEHTGLGTGSGRFGYCPGMMEGTSIDVQWTGDGAVMTIRADEPAKVDRLQRATHKRLRALDARMRKTARG